MELALQIIVSVLYLLIIVCHSFGCYLLLCLHKNEQDSTRQLYLINLSIIEAVGSIVGLVAIRIPKLFSVPWNNVQTYASIVLYTLFTFVYYANLFLIMIDKLMYILLNIKYPVYWNEAKTKVLLAVTWLLGVLIWIGMSLATYFTGYAYDNDLFKYFYPILDILFIIVVTVSYSVIFHMYKKTRLTPTESNSKRTRKRQRKKSNFQIFRNSRFYVSGLLIVTFLLFVVIPDLIYLFFRIKNGKENETLDDIILILFLVSYLSDAIIYIFMQVPVRRLLWKKLFKSTRLSCFSKPTEFQQKLTGCTLTKRQLSNGNMAVSKL